MSGSYGPAVESVSKADADTGWNSLEQCCAPGCIFFPGSSAGKESACKAGDLGSISGSGTSVGEGKGYPLQYSGLENSMDCIVHGVAKSWTRLSNFHFHIINSTDHVIFQLPVSFFRHS